MGIITLKDGQKKYSLIMTLDLNRADSILIEAKSYGVVEAIPETEKGRIQAAEELLQYAKIQWEQFHNREPVISAILFAGQVDGGTPSGAQIKEPFECYDELSMSDIKSSIKEDFNIEPFQEFETFIHNVIRYEEHGKNRQTLIKWLKETLEEIRPSEAEAEIGQDESIPETNEETALDLIVDDFTTLSDTQLRQLHSKFNAIASRSAFMVMHEENAASDCKLVANDIEDRLIRDHPQNDGKKSKSLLQSLVSDDKELSEWRKRQAQHEANVRRYKTEHEVSISNVERISREWTMRTKEVNSSGTLPRLIHQDGR